jgi:Predicted DNA-binding protein containing a Zn-ribbon domain
LPVAHIGIDDTDSNYLGMCTTYIGALIEDELRGLGYAGAGEPRLVRLNPAYPMKTRGNGAIHLRYRVEGRADAMRLFGRVEDILARSAALADSKVDPGLVMIVTPDASPPAALSPIYEEALRRIVSLPAAIRLLASLGAIASWFKSGRGLVGAAAAIGAPGGRHAHVRAAGVPLPGLSARAPAGRRGVRQDRRPGDLAYDVR